MAQSKSSRGDPHRTPYVKMPLVWDEGESPPPVKVELPPRVMATFRLLHVTLIAWWVMGSIVFVWFLAQSWYGWRLR